MNYKHFYPLLVCFLLLVSCDSEEDYNPYTPPTRPVEDTRNDNRNIGGDVVTSRIETPNVNAAFLLVPHYATLNGKQVLNYIGFTELILINCMSAK